MDGASALGSPATLSGSGVATYTTSALSTAVHSITAVYSGDTERQAKTSSVVTQTVATAPAGSGSCTAGNAANNCTSGLCNVTTGICADANGASCSAANQCTGNFCGSNGHCGIADGQTGCTAGTAALCQSGACSSTASSCVPATNGCYVDADCASADHCNRNTFTCDADFVAGVQLPVDGLHDGVCGATLAGLVCASGACNPVTNTCSAANGVACTGPSNCTANACGNNGLCGVVDGGSGCTAATATLCQSGACSATASSCVPATNGCYVDADCASTDHCNRTTLHCDADFVAGVPLPVDAIHDGVCGATLAGLVCASGDCNPVTNTCSAANSVVCTDPSECTANICSPNGHCGRDLGEGPCTVATGLAVCQSGTCNAAADGSVSACIPASSGSCFVDADCGSTEFCARATFTCTTKLASGAALPSDALHTTCGASAVNAACVTGLCNAVTSTCAAANSTTCTLAAECTDNRCGSNGKCGASNGESGCTALNAAALCQSGVCASTSGTCVPAGGCWNDSDCATGQHCDQHAFTCASNLAAGGTIPSDGLHDGTCSAANATALCASGLCNATANTCAAATGADCATASQCVVNACGSNGKCGLTAGQFACTAATASVCQSGTCSVSGACIPETTGSCWVDGDCTPAQHCKRDTFTCVADVASGEPVPNDALHTGVCSDATALATCVSGTCNKVTNTCASSNGVTCARANECVANVCGGNGKCGLVDGQKGCDVSGATSCQSGACSIGGVCVPAGKCWDDSECGADQYCARASFACTAKARAGEAIPNDGLHDGKCADANAKATCASGVCNATTNTCGAPVATACSAASQCANNICSDDGSCGQPGGQVCASDSACRSGACIEGACTIAGARAGGHGLIECAVSEPGGNSTGISPWYLLAGLATLIRRRRPSGGDSSANPS